MKDAMGNNKGVELNRIRSIVEEEWSAKSLLEFSW